MDWVGGLKTKILGTVGPASLSLEVLRRMYEAGMNGVRINTVFGDFDQYEGIIENVRSIGEIPFLLDINGPGMRIKTLKPRSVGKGEVIKVGHGQSVMFNYNVYDQIDIGDRIFIDDGKLQTEVIEKGDGWISLLIKNKGMLKDRKGVNIPRKSLEVPPLSEKDLEVIEFAKENEVEFIGLSFTRSQEDVLNLRRIAGGLEAGIIAKIENFQGVENFKGILDEADGVMIARGDLGVEIEPEKVPLVQKQMISRCNQRGKPVITATDMLDSMVNNPRPTRAEVSDVANAILDGTDVVMLSEETSIGRYPIESVSMMARIAEKAEATTVSKVEEERFRDISSAISRSVWQIAQTMPLDKVVTITRTGYTARMISRFRLRQPIIAVTASRLVKNQLALVYGVHPVQLNYEGEKDQILAVAQMLYRKGIFSEEDTVLFTAGFRTSQKHASNIIEIHTIRELLGFGRGKK